MHEAIVRLKKWALGWWSWQPHFVVGDPARPYLLRWYIIPRNPWLNIYLHKFLRDDDDRALHDHPWESLSFLLLGRYVEETPDGLKTEHRAGSFIRRSATYAHRVELPQSKPCWTLFVTGPVCREWGFHCPQGWRRWQDFVAPNNPGQPGPGCD